MRSSLLCVGLLLAALAAEEEACSATPGEDGEKSECGCGSDKLTRDAVPEDVAVRAAAVESAASTRTDDSGATLRGPRLVSIPGGLFTMGTDKPGVPGDGESPARPVRVSPFAIDATEVSNEQFAAFVENTSFVSESEKFGWSFVFHLALSKEQLANITQAVAGAEWWLPVSGSTWLEPEGPGSNVFKTDRANHPVVQVSWSDAVAFCAWRGEGMRLPTEAEWEYASRGGLEQTRFPWGTKLYPKNEYRANLWQGDFPKKNTAADGWHFTAPVDAYAPQNDYGVYNMIGNVWEWVDDWWYLPSATDANREQVNPKGPSEGTEKMKKGGSFLCHKSYCYRYRSAARHKNTPDSATSNNGFRCAKSLGHSSS